MYAIQAFITVILSSMILLMTLNNIATIEAMPRPDIWDDINKVLSSVAIPTRQVDASDLQDILNSLKPPAGDLPIQLNPFTVVYGGGDSGVAQETLVVPVPQIRQIVPAEVVTATATSFASATVADISIVTATPSATATTTEDVATVGAPVATTATVQ